MFILCNHDRQNILTDERKEHGNLQCYQKHKITKQNLSSFQIDKKKRKNLVESQNVCIWMERYDWYDG